MTSEIESPDAGKAKIADPIVTERLPKVVFESMPSPFFPQARMIYPREIKIPEPATEPIAPKSTDNS